MDFPRVQPFGFVHATVQSNLRALKDMFDDSSKNMSLKLSNGRVQVVVVTMEEMVNKETLASSITNPISDYNDVIFGGEDLIQLLQSNIIQDSLDDTAKALQNAQGSLAGFDNLNVLTQPDEDEENTEDLPVTANEVDDVSGAIDSLKDNMKSVNCGAFDILANKVKSALKVIEPIAAAVKNNVQTTVDTAQQSIQKYLSKYGGKIGEYSESIKTHLKNAAAQTSNCISNLLNEAAAIQSRMSDEMSTGYADLLGGTSIFTLSYSDVFTSMLDTISKNFEEFVSRGKGLSGIYYIYREFCVVFG